MFFHASIQCYGVISILALCGLLLPTQKSKADPLLNTDDASITDAHRCQLETSYLYLKDGAWSYQVTPACNLNQNLEVSIGYHATKELDQVRGFSAQVKTVVKPMENDWGIATSLTLSRDDQAEQRTDLDWFLNVPVSFNFLDQRLALHSNLGYQYAQDHARLLRWSIATNYALTDRLALSVETYNQDRQAPLFQTAVHYSLIPNVLTLAASFGDRLHDFRQQWFGFGLSFTPASP
ncbi:hypothetical protein MMO38_03955 [Acinetobacter sp. NIPH 1852]|uniref:hypothetical protein n=1 Tax=Acinetobacter sp. NIPH 1852 TaxID=2923428 RepID=UPI001B4F1B01|nr:hypothetical protein [Acinetobacter sp. NIPH 1852]MBP8006557.1 hypothetical protein [Acinetobacter sp.]MCH7307299.1 hypothetical protein [Acinetobacter sp. NIPH 1852]